MFIPNQHAERLKDVRSNEESASSMSEMNKLIEGKVIKRTVGNPSERRQHT